MRAADTDLVAKQERLVRLNRAHVRAALWFSVPIAVGSFLLDVVPHGVSMSDVFWVIGYFGLLVVGLTWANWYEDNKLEREVRARGERFRRLAPRPKVR